MLKGNEWETYSATSYNHMPSPPMKIAVATGHREFASLPPHKRAETSSSQVYLHLHLFHPSSVLVCLRFVRGSVAYALVVSVPYQRLNQQVLLL